MKSPLFWVVILAVATWQIELAVHSGIAASRRPVVQKGAPPTNKATAPICTGTSCPPSPPQSAPQRVIVTPR